MTEARLAVDIGGTFTDIAVENGDSRFTHKVLTTPRAPEEGVLDGVRAALDRTGLTPASFRLIIHGTTLATNAIIERKGARTAMVVTEGFRDVIEIAFENRFEQYDIFMDRPPPLVPRHLRLGVPERIDARGNVLIPFESDSLGAVIATLREEQVESVAIGLMHSYVDSRHEDMIAEALSAALPDISITRSSEVSPEIREFERWSTAAANAYIQPLMASYMERLDASLREMGFACPLNLMTSGGGLTTIETGQRFPIRLVESGPAGGAILAAGVARECEIDKVLSFDMGGTTAKICLIDDGEPQYSRSFEVARQYRFLKGSGLPLRIPVIEMVEIGAGGGSIAQVDTLSRIHVGPESAGSEPGPACYGRGGDSATVTDADVVLGRIDPEGFAGGTMTLDAGKARSAVEKNVGAPLGLSAIEGGSGISEIVVENMANAARVHAVERGKNHDGRTLIAFGGAAPLHAARLAQKLGIRRVIVPAAAGVGSAVGFLRAPISYEVVRSRYACLDDTFDPAPLNALYAEMREEAEAIVAGAAGGAALVEQRTADMRYRGQGHEITVNVPTGMFDAATREALSARFDMAYDAAYSRRIPHLDIEVMNWTLRLSAALDPSPACPPMPAAYDPEPAARRAMFDAGTEAMGDVPVYDRAKLKPGASIPGPAVIAEAETATVVLASFTARVNALGYIVMTREIG